MTAFLRLENVHKAWGGVVGVDGIDLTIARGEFTVLLGPSGCGKSTLLRLVAGLEAPDRGRIFIDGKDVTGSPPASRGLSMVFQSYALFPHLSVAENIVFGLRVRGVAKAERTERLAKALALTGLNGLEHRKPAELSGGQRQRVALARAVIADHPICLMDEPLSNLDAKLRHSVRQDIRAMQRELGMTVIYVTHDQTEAMGMADRIVLLNAGRVEQSGTPADFYRSPATIFAATFIGSPPMALLPANSIPAALQPRRAAQVSQAGTLVGVRPEDMRIVSDREQGVRARIASSEFLGAETLVYLDMGTAEIVARVAGEATFKAGASVSVTWPP
ncbi:MAG TPA: ABC transporter ATP-binding protein, partial [Xanthobacteraceae bacterium]|nr:ABC transporter ATP-binding protein [Xanthobacteraceae bacterium]